jgi:hypothetical protein
MVSFSAGQEAANVYVQFSGRRQGRRGELYLHAVPARNSRWPNQLLGTTPTFQAVFYTTFQGQAI